MIYLQVATSKATFLLFQIIYTSVISWKMVHQKIIYILHCETYKCSMIWVKNRSLQVWLSWESWGDYPSSSRWALNAITNVQRERERSNLTQKEDNTTIAGEFDVMWPQVKKCWHLQVKKYWQPLASGSLLQPPKEAQPWPCQHLDLGSMILILDF